VTLFFFFSLQLFSHRKPLNIRSLSLRSTRCWEAPFGSYGPCVLLPPPLPVSPPFFPWQRTITFFISGSCTLMRFGVHLCRRVARRVASFFLDFEFFLTVSLLADDDRASAPPSNFVIFHLDALYLFSANRILAVPAPVASIFFPPPHFSWFFFFTSARRLANFVTLSIRPL